MFKFEFWRTEVSDSTDSFYLFVFTVQQGHTDVNAALKASDFETTKIKILENLFSGMYIPMSGSTWILPNEKSYQ